MLRTAPGLYIGRGEGPAIAHNYMLRGFDADHGQDLELTRGRAADQPAVAPARPGLRGSRLPDRRRGARAARERRCVRSPPGRLCGGGLDRRRARRGRGRPRYATAQLLRFLQHVSSARAVGAPRSVHGELRRRALRQDGRLRPKSRRRERQRRLSAAVRERRRDLPRAAHPAHRARCLRGRSPNGRRRVGQALLRLRLPVPDRTRPKHVGQPRIGRPLRGLSPGRRLERAARRVHRLRRVQAAEQLHWFSRAFAQLSTMSRDAAISSSNKTALSPSV